MATQQHEEMGTLIYVYGTLKTGMANYEHKMVHYPCCKLLAHAKTLNKYPLIVAGERKVPYLFDSEGIGHQIEGEVYRVVDAKHLEELDIFEGCDTGHYNRIPIEVIVTSVPESSEWNVGSIVKCFVYMRNKQAGDEEFLKEHEHEMIPSFTSEHNQFYQRAADHIG
ncbi:predicted protein [Naegleria gruberi]|uniref:Gamma-glutamylcyclotransferase family protein n=1 Tax=Naegleria gruberi TaxID=5762 RepID=D2VDE9_NAEGR|nr:uncharacterized protein NAEGRDRAFT_66818 [Naegleria gruberi]EFC45221.1 predicted protein [Naegleria gruberi]|eukprot:XP_002677965.1 predicted protein [Naegleria gruberi strain NEG-M]